MQSVSILWPGQYSQIAGDIYMIVYTFASFYILRLAHIAGQPTISILQFVSLSQLARIAKEQGISICSCISQLILLYFMLSTIYDRLDTWFCSVLYHIEWYSLCNEYKKQNKHRTRIIDMAIDIITTAYPSLVQAWVVSYSFYRPIGPRVLNAMINASRL